MHAIMVHAIKIYAFREIHTCTENANTAAQQHVQLFIKL